MGAHRICLSYDVFWCTKKLFGAIISSDVALFGEAIMVDWIIIAFNFNAFNSLLTKLLCSSIDGGDNVKFNLLN